ncbi:MAG TPA: hypothetical protein VHT91_37180 [Kofleriaceae bacterium]|jgi:hypothetical protein|nr:hypothetical protein [Kofleriaceae bacterium]
MRNLGSRCAVLGAVLLVSSGVARADDPVAGSYEAKFEQIGNNCEHSISFSPRGIVKIEVKGGDLQVDIERTPLMIGKPRKDGKINAKSRVGHTRVEGMDGVFTVAGRITPEDGMLSLTLIGEYQAGGKPLCTQSWSLSGLKAKADEPPAKR